MYGKPVARRYIVQSERIKALNKSTLDLLDDILTRGQQQGIFIDGLNTVDVHRLLSSICVHHVANRYTFHFLFTPGGYGRGQHPP